jgi:cytoskeletal protein RodZ
VYTSFLTGANNMNANNELNLPPLTLGAQLKQARQAKKLSIVDVADRLRLSPLVIEAIEEEKYLQSGGLDAFMRGYIRAYADMMDISAVTIEQEFTRLGVTTIVNNANEIQLDSKSDFKQPTIGDKPFKITTIIIIGLLVALVVSWVWMHHA